LTLPKSASFLDRFAQNDAAVDRCGLTGALTSPEYPNSGGNPPFWFQFGLGLALTRGLKQNANPDTFLGCPAFPRRITPDATGVFFHPGDDSDEQPLPEGDRSQFSQSLSESAPLAGDIPRSNLWRGSPLTVPEYSTGNCLDCFLRRPGKTIENQEGEEEDGGSIESRRPVESVFNLSDLDLNKLEKSENFWLCFLYAAVVVVEEGVV
jgi:hypothetical protein